MNTRFLSLTLLATLLFALALPSCGEIPPPSRSTQETMTQRIPTEEPPATPSPAPTVPPTPSEQPQEPGGGDRSSTGPPPSSHRPMSYDAGRNVTVLYTGGGTWEYSGTAWQPVTTTNVPHLDMGTVMAYDQARGLTVLGGLRANYY